MNSRGNLEKWLSHIRTYRVPVFEKIRQTYHFQGTGMEIGAGTCWLSALLSQSSVIEKMTAVEISQERLDLARSFFIPELHGNPDKIRFFAGDFHERLPVEEQSLDFIVCDAALHHSQNLPGLLQNLKRYLKPKGALIAMREPILPSFVPLRIWRKLTFGLMQRLHGDVEKTYTKKEWIRTFAESGFGVQFHPSFLSRPFKEKMVTLLGRFNGILFNRYFLIARQK